MPTIDRPGPKVPDDASNWPTEFQAQTPKQTKTQKTALPSTTTSISQAAKSRAAISLSGNPILAPAQSIHFDAEVSEEELSNAALDSVIETLEELVATISESATAAILPKDVSRHALSEFLEALSTTLLAIKKMQRDIEGDIGTKSRALLLALAALAELSVNENFEKLLLVYQLEALKYSGQHIITGYRIILGDRPDLMLRLLLVGIVPPLEGGGPYDGMAQKYAAKGIPPYNNPIYAAMAYAVPGGWEELSMDEIDEVIEQLRKSMAPPPIVKNSALLKTIAMHAIHTTAQRLKPIMHRSPGLLKMLLAQKQLNDLLQSHKKDKFITLSRHPALMLTLASYDIIPPGKPSPLIQKSIDQGIPPYNDPIYAAMGKSIPAELSIADLKKMMKKLDEMIDTKMQAPMTILPFHLPFPGSPQTLSPLIDKKILKSFIDPSHPAPLFFLSPSQNETVRMLAASVAITQGLFLAIHPINPRKMDQMAKQIIDQWVGRGIADKLVNNLFGFSGTHPLERKLMAQALISFALVSTLMHAYHPSTKKFTSILNELIKHEPYAKVASVTLVLLRVQRQVEIAALKFVIAELLKGIEADQEQLENLKTLEALIKEIIKQVERMLESEEYPEDETKAPPSMHIQA